METQTELIEAILMTLTLYEISFEGALIASILEESEGELTPEIEQRIEDLMKAGPGRIEAAAMVVRNLEASAEACENEVKRLAARAHAFQVNATRLKELMTMAIDTAFNGKVKTPKFTVYTQASADHVAFDVAPEHTIEEVEAFDSSLVRVSKELDKIALKERWKAGHALPVAIQFEVTPGKRSTRIK
jgi:hypothetical protein